MKLQTIGLAILGVLFLAVAVYYWVTPAGSLLTFMPGYAAGSSAMHTKHALASLILAIGCGVLLWFTAGKKTSTPTTEA